MVGLIFAASALYGAYSSYKAGQDNAGRERANARLAAKAAADALQRGEQAAGRARYATSRRVAAQRTAYARSGVDANAGTAADVQAETAAIGEYEAQLEKNNAYREAMGYAEQGRQFDESARDAEKAGLFGAVGAVVGALGSYYGTKKPQ